jgi:hypothetical protein
MRGARVFEPLPARFGGEGFGVRASLVLGLGGRSLLVRVERLARLRLERGFLGRLFGVKVRRPVFGPFSRIGSPQLVVIHGCSERMGEAQTLLGADDRTEKENGPPGDGPPPDCAQQPPRAYQRRRPAEPRTRETRAGQGSPCLAASIGKAPAA